MAFEGYELVFDGVSCSKYDLMLYDIGSNKQSDTIKITSAGKIISDKMANKPTSILYGTEQNEPLSFSVVLTASPKRIETNQPFDRFELQAIYSWLSGHNTWKWMKIIQPDLEPIKYRCIITELNEISYDGLIWALGCTVTCDSPYAYTNQSVSEFVIDSIDKNILFRNKSSYNGIFYPQLNITLGTSRTITIINQSNKNNTFKFTNIPLAVTDITIDNEKQIITNNTGVNLYPYFNFGWLGLVRGDNNISVSGDCTLKFICDFPVNVGA